MQLCQALYGHAMNELGEVIPKNGIGKIQLGEFKSTLLSVLGNPVRESKKRHDRSSCDYVGFNLIFNADDILESIEVYPETRITYKGLEIFDGSNAWKQLISDDPNPFYLSGTIILLALGVSMWEDPEEEEQNKSFVLSADVAWDKLKDKLKPYVKKGI